MMVGEWSHLNLRVVVPRAERSHLRQPALLRSRRHLQRRQTFVRFKLWPLRQTREGGSEQWRRTLLELALSMRPYSSQCSLSSAHAYPSRRDLRKMHPRQLGVTCSDPSGINHTRRCSRQRRWCEDMRGMALSIPVHPHLQRSFQAVGGGGDDPLGAHSHRDVVEKRLRQLLLHLHHVLHDQGGSAPSVFTREGTVGTRFSGGLRKLRSVTRQVKVVRWLTFSRRRPTVGD
jgi:hypothetical protein